MIFCSQITIHLMTQENTVLLFCSRIGWPLLPGSISRSGLVAGPELWTEIPIGRIPPASGDQTPHLCPLGLFFLEQKFSGSGLYDFPLTASSLPALASYDHSTTYSRVPGNVHLIREHRFACILSLNPSAQHRRAQRMLRKEASKVHIRSSLGPLKGSEPFPLEYEELYLG